MGKRHSLVGNRRRPGIRINTAEPTPRNAKVPLRPTRGDKTSLSKSELPRAAIVYHPYRAPLARLHRAVAIAEKEQKWEPSIWLPIVGTESVNQAVRRAVQAGVRVVIAAGGDGTTNAVATALRGLEVPLAVIPTGTANLFARNMGIPIRDVSSAVRIAFSGVEQTIDLGSIDYRLVDGTESSRYFTVMSGFGIDADMATNTDPTVKRRFGWAAYVRPILHSLYQVHKRTVTLIVDGKHPIETQLHSVFVGNCGTITAGWRLLPEAQINNGYLDLLAIRSTTLLDQLRLLRWLLPYNSPFPLNRATGFRRSQSGSRTFSYLRGRLIELTLPGGVTMQADGDAIGSIIWVRFSIEPSALAVRVPKSCV